MPVAKNGRRRQIKAGLNLYRICLGLSGLIVLCALTFVLAQSDNAADSDNDGLADTYEIFYGLDITTNDAGLDYDGDALSNIEESKKLTDPFFPDTDRDGFNDLIDSNAVSRAYVCWGDPQFTTGDQYEYAHPDWLLGAYKNGGEWVVTSQVWCVSAYESNGVAISSGWRVSECERKVVGSLNIDLDRTILTNNLRYAVHYVDNNKSSLYLDLLDTNGVIVAGDLFGNLLTVSNVARYVVIPALASAKRSGEAGEAGLPELGQGIQSTNAVLLLEIPTANFPSAAVIQLRCETGELIVYEGLLYIDEDGDGLDADQERQLGTSDYSIDSNNNGTNDYDECFNAGSSTNNPDGGGGGNDDGDDGKDDHDGPKPKIIYVDQAIGNDAFTGRTSVPTSQKVGTNKKGPKKTVRAGLSVAETNDTIIIRSGVYNENLDIRGKDVKVFIEGNVRL